MATLLLHEIVWKREAAIAQLIQGLKLLNILDVIQKHPQHFQDFFVLNDDLSSANLGEHISFLVTSSSDEERSKDFFSQYIEDNVTICLGEGMVFWK